MNANALLWCIVIKLQPLSIDHRSLDGLQMLLAPVIILYYIQSSN